MTAVFIIGFLLFIFSIIYLFVHFFKKAKNRERTLSKKIFYPSLIGGLLLFFIGGSNMDAGVQNQLNEALVKNEKLVAENTDLKNNNTKLQEENENLNKKIKKLNSKITGAEKIKQELMEQKTAFEKEKEDLNKEISNLEDSNESLENEVNSLNTQLTNANSSSSSTSTSTTTSVSSSGGYEAFDNCTDLRGTYPSGVPEGHPAYVPSMDRDKDGYACER